MLTVRSTLMWAVLTGQTDWVCHIGTYAVCTGSCLELYYCNMVECFWWDSGLILTTNWFPSVLWHCWFGHLACKNRPRNDLLCVEWDVKPYTLTLLNCSEEFHQIYNFVALEDKDEVIRFWGRKSRLWPDQLGSEEAGVCASAAPGQVLAN